MKKFLLLLLLGSSLPAFSQNDPSLNQEDVKSAPVKAMPAQSAIPYRRLSSLAAFGYDSVRAITELNTAVADDYAWISPDGLRLYYFHGAPNRPLMFTQRSNTKSLFSAPVQITFNFPGSASVVSYALSNDELDVYMSSGNTLYTAHRTSLTTPFNTPVLLTLTGINYSFVSGASLNAAQTELFLFCSNYTTGTIAKLTRTSPTAFTFHSFLNIPAGYSPKPGQLSKDGLTYFVGAEFNGLDGIYQLTRSTPTGTFAASTFEPVHGINSPTLYTTMPTVSDNQEWMIFSRCPQGTWTTCDLYMAGNNKITAVFEPENLKASASVFPNPATDLVFLEVADFRNAKAEIVNPEGKLLKSISLQTAKTEIKIDHLPAGIYFVNVISPAGSSFQKLVKQ